MDSDWLIAEHYSHVKHTGGLRAYKSQAKSHITNNSLTFNVQPLWGDPKLRPCRIDLAIGKVLGSDFCIKTSLSVNESVVNINFPSLY